MRTHKRPSIFARLSALMLALALILACAGLLLQAAGVFGGPRETLLQARERLEAAGSYRIQLDLEQLLTPRATPATIGQSEERITLSGTGSVVLPDRSTLTLRAAQQPEAPPLTLISHGGQMFAQVGDTLKPAEGQ